MSERLYDAGANMPEKTLVTIGDDCALNEGATIQGHSMEDGAFKSDRIKLGSRCSVGVDAWINYGATMHDGSVLGADALLMKGEDVPENATCTGNPAREVLTPAPVLEPIREPAQGSRAAGMSRGLRHSTEPRHRRSDPETTGVFLRFPWAARRVQGPDQGEDQGEAALPGSRS